MKTLTAFLFCPLLAFAASVGTAAEDNGATNLQVLPEDIPRAQLNQAMLQNLTGLGLPRREGEGCLFCHEGSMDTPRSEWDFASDAKATKDKARVMMRMVQDINNQLGDLEERVAPDMQVSCDTCHGGRTDPRPLQQLLLSAYREEGIEAALSNYHELRGRFFGSDAYDFQEASLTSVATNLALRGEFDDAITISELNETMNPSLATTGFTLTLQTMQQILVAGVDQGIAYFEQRWQGLGSPEQGFVVLDNVGWQLFRTRRQAEALQIFEHNVSLFPLAYVPHESLADALLNTGDEVNGERALQIFESWLRDNPGHDTAQRRLLQLRSAGN